MFDHVLKITADGKSLANLCRPDRNPVPRLTRRDGRMADGLARTCLDENGGHMEYTLQLFCRDLNTGDFELCCSELRNI